MSGHQVRAIGSKKEFEELVKSNKVIYVDFTATWCGPCRMISPEFAKLAQAHGGEGVEFVKVDIDDQADLAEEYGISVVPTFHSFKNGSHAGSIVGADRNKLAEFVQNGVRGL